MIDLIFNQSLKETKLSKDNNDKKNIKYSSTKHIKTNAFLKTNQKVLNPIKKKNESGAADNKRYFQSSINNNVNEYKPKDKLDTMRKSLFTNSNMNKNLNTKDAIGILSGKNSKMKSSNFVPKVEAFSGVAKEDNKAKNNERNNANANVNKNKDNKKREKCKSKEKSKNNLAGKETKAYISTRRNESSNTRRKSSKSTLDSISSISNKNNLQWEHN